ncbi:MAG: GNAT family N-acetyltransferase [Bifidobacteriaceae bacterium]|jgi:ribosomal protein S18 acetylase RimI-like enzyme|nr:GNAT family N-acetyltransferase [Bifidobacteriaceae bacterium]
MPATDSPTLTPAAPAQANSEPNRYVLCHIPSNADFTQLSNKFDGREMLVELLREIIADSQDEFVPPLFSRNSTTQSNLIENLENTGDAYVCAVASQENILFLHNDKIVGVLSYIKDTNQFPNLFKPENAYLTTVIVDKDYRRKRIAQTMYQAFEQLNKRGNLYTRTWSKNDSHIKLLLKRGYAEVHRIADDRGKGIDTVYYGKETK